MKRQSAPYRVPPNPGYVGGYNWRAMLAGFALLLLSNFAGTQFIAYRFQYQPALGNALFRVGGFALYQPFAWSIWVLRYMNAKNPDVRLPVQLGLLAVVAGCAATIGVFFLINMRRTKRLSANTEDIHGSARWASEEDVHGTGLLDAQSAAYTSEAGMTIASGSCAICAMTGRNTFWHSHRRAPVKALAW